MIHGGNVFDTYEDYLTDLKGKQVTLERLVFKGWKSSLGERLGESFTVFLPQMPNGQNAKYLEWKIYFEKLVPLMEPGMILIGHSLGGIFLAKYLSEETFPVSVRATFLLAAPFATPTNHPLGDFTLSEPLEKLTEQSERLFLYHSQDDVVVPYSNALDYKSVLPKAVLRDFTDRGHFNTETFPELEQDLRTVTANH